MCLLHVALKVQKLFVAPNIIDLINFNLKDYKIP